ncbi:MAG: tRNA (guanosine(37)-N1)-methyltransferase TrmD [Planctomycetes bacterium]|nr:tRNA (guanosine(37)-N1)-methyltransferase TrmD [Planctomycetota bacterium]
MRIYILTLFPTAVEAYLAAGILGIARHKRLIDVRVVNFRQYGLGRHRAVDDRPFGGGPGMVLRPEPVLQCVENIEAREGELRKVLLTPSGRPFDQAGARDFATSPSLLLLCGRYEGFDERIRECTAWEEVSLGDFVLCGGELAALAVVEATVRLLPGVLGHEASSVEESFSTVSNDGSLDEGPGLEYPQYTRPRVFRGRAVPDVLLSGDHQAVREWRRSRARERTAARRPDLLGSRVMKNPSEPGPEVTGDEPDRRD